MQNILAYYVHNIGNVTMEQDMINMQEVLYRDELLHIFLQKNYPRKFFIDITNHYHVLPKKAYDPSSNPG